MLTRSAHSLVPPPPPRSGSSYSHPDSPSRSTEEAAGPSHRSRLHPQLQRAHALSAWKASPLRTSSLSTLSVEFPVFRQVGFEDDDDEGEEEVRFNVGRQQLFGDRDRDRVDNAPSEARDSGTGIQPLKAELASASASNRAPIAYASASSSSTSSYSTEARVDTGSCPPSTSCPPPPLLPVEVRSALSPHPEHVGPSDPDSRTRNIGVVTGSGGRPRSRSRSRSRTRRFGVAKARGFLKGKSKVVFVDTPKSGFGKSHSWDHFSSTGRGGLGNIRPLISSKHSRNQSHDSSASSSHNLSAPSLTTKHESLILDIRRLTIDDHDMALLSMGVNRTSTSTTSSKSNNASSSVFGPRSPTLAQISVSIPRTRSLASLRSACTHSSVSTHSTRSSYTTQSLASASYHALPEIDIDETDHLASSPGTHLSPTTLAYLRPYAPNADTTPAAHSSARRSGMASAHTKGSALAKLISPSSYSLSLSNPGLSPGGEHDIEQGASPYTPITPSSSVSSVPPDMFVSTAGREVPVAHGFFDRAFMKATMTAKAGGGASAYASATAASTAPTHTGSDPPSSPTSVMRSKSTSASKKTKSKLTLYRKTSAYVLGESNSKEDEFDEEAFLEEMIKQKAKAAARTGRGGLGNPSKLILARRKWMDGSQHPTTAALMVKHEAMLAAQERAIIEQSNTNGRTAHSTGRGGAGNLSAGNISARKINMVRSRSVGRGVTDGVLGRRRRSSSVSSIPPIPSQGVPLTRQRTNSLSRTQTVTQDDKLIAPRAQSRSRALTQAQAQARISAENARSRSRSSVRSATTTKGRKIGKVRGMRIWWRRKEGGADASRKVSNGGDGVHVGGGHAPPARGREIGAEGRESIIYISSAANADSGRDHEMSFASTDAARDAAVTSRREASFSDSILDLAVPSSSPSFDDEDAYAQAAYQDYDDGVEEEPDVYDVDLDLPPSPTRLRAISACSMNGATSPNRPFAPMLPYAMSHPYRHSDFLASQRPQPSPQRPLPQRPFPTDPIPPRTSSLPLEDLPVRALAAAKESGMRAQAKRLSRRSRSGSILGSNASLGRGEAQVSVGGVKMDVVAL